MQQSSTNLAWAAGVEWTQTPGASGRDHISFYRSGQPVCRLAVASQAAAALGAPGGLATLDAGLVAFLTARRLVIAVGAAALTVDIFYPGAAAAVATFSVPASRSLRLAVLCGDELALALNFPAFLAARSAGTLVSALTIGASQLRLAPVRLTHEAARPRRSEAMPRCFPTWRARSAGALSWLQALLAEAASGPVWYGLTVSGAVHAGVWEEARSGYRPHTRLIAAPSPLQPFFMVEAGIEGRTTSGGTGARLADAELAARCEAWERFCLERPDLARPAPPDLAPYGDAARPAIHYLQQLTTPLANAPQLVEGRRLSNDERVAVPSAWVYFGQTAVVVNTSGAAYGATGDEAVAYARFELIERHAFLRVFFGLAPGRRLTPGEAAAATAQAWPGEEASYYTLGTVDGVETIVCVLRSSQPPFAVVGAAARPCRRAAVAKAVQEAAAARAIFAQRLSHYGSAGFLAQGARLAAQPPATIDLLAGAWIWAAQRDAAAKLDAHLHTGLPGASTLAPRSYVAVDIGRGVVPVGSVVKVLHEDALPLPSNHAQTLHLAAALGCASPPLPLT